MMIGRSGKKNSARSLSEQTGRHSPIRPNIDGHRDTEDVIVFQPNRPGGSRTAAHTAGCCDVFRPEWLLARPQTRFLQSGKVMPASSGQRGYYICAGVRPDCPGPALPRHRRITALSLTTQTAAQVAEA